MSQARGSAALC